MNHRISALISKPLVPLLIFSLTACQPSSPDSAEHPSGKAEILSDDFERGAHGGRLLSEGAFSIELAIYETGAPPRYRIYGYRDGKQISPEDFTAEVALRRLGGREEQFTFFPTQDFLATETPVEEPHSFDVAVKASFNGEQYAWNFMNYEGRVTISDKVAELSGLKTEKAQAKNLKSLLRLRGKIFPSEHKIAHIIPRFSGVVREGRKHIGDRVEKGEVVAVVESNQSLQPFEVRSQISGIVINGHVIVGEFVPENQWIYIVADLSEVWADFFVPLRAHPNVLAGQKLLLTSLNGDRSVDGIVSYLAPYADDRSQTQLVRVVLLNADNQFLPGTFVLGDLVTREYRAPVAVKQSGIQNIKKQPVVFVKYQETYEIRPIELGNADGEWIEVVNGLSAGEEYVSDNAFLIKADVLKSGAEHEH